MMNDRPIPEIAQIIMSMRDKAPVKNHKLDNLRLQANHKRLNQKHGEEELKAIERGEYESKGIFFSDVANQNPNNVRKGKVTPHQKDIHSRAMRSLNVKKQLTLINPKGERITESSAYGFAKHGLSQASVSRLVKGKKKAIKGWKLANDETRRCTPDVGSICNP